MKEPDIRCPACAWHPKAESRWVCLPACGTEWHTFWSAGVCPGCAHRWYRTQCLECGVASPHKDWYHFPEEDEKVVEEEITETAGA